MHLDMSKILAGCMKIYKGCGRCSIAYSRAVFGSRFIYWYSMRRIRWGMLL